MYHDFNPRLRKGDDLYICCLWTPLISISIHVSARETTFVRLLGIHNQAISIHVSARETTKSIGFMAQCFFISIHVSARETTVVDQTTGALNMEISIHVSARETTLQTLLGSLSYTLFQSTSPQGRRQGFGQVGTTIQGISIHVSARETTDIRTRVVYTCKNFNPRLRKGDDTPPLFRYAIPESFQSTSPQGRRLILLVH